MARPKNTALCIEEGCSNAYYARDLCLKHYQATYRKTFPSRASKAQQIREFGSRTGMTYKAVVEYRAAHKRVEVARGKARAHFCIDCPNRAQEWSLSHDATDVLVSEAFGSMGKAYSLDVMSYDPRCSSCHRKADMAVAA